MYYTECTACSSRLKVNPVLEINWSLQWDWALFKFLPEYAVHFICKHIPGSIGLNHPSFWQIYQNIKKDVGTL